jgi:hypothetical protein
VSWQALAEDAPDLAAFGAKGLHDRVACLATLKPDGAPRLHPVRPVVTAGRLLVFSGPTSPTVGDLQRDGLYAFRAYPTTDSAQSLAPSCRDRAREPEQRPRPRPEGTFSSTFRLDVITASGF